MLPRHAISDADWDRIKDRLPGRPGQTGWVAKDNRLFMDAVLWIAKTGAPWRDVPERFGNWNSIWKRFDRWSRKGTFILGSLFLIGFALPYFALLHTRQPIWVVTAVVLALTVGHALLYSVQASLIPELFGTRLRYTGASLSYQLASVVAGGPYTCQHAAGQSGTLRMTPAMKAGVAGHIWTVDELLNEVEIF